MITEENIFSLNLECYSFDSVNKVFLYDLDSVSDDRVEITADYIKIVKYLQTHNMSFHIEENSFIKVIL